MNERKNSEHLTEGQISRLLVEGPARNANAHLAICEGCQLRLAEAKAPLRSFRIAFVSWSEAQPAARPAQSFKWRNDRNWLVQLWLPAAGLAVAAMLLLGFVAGPGWLHGHSIAQPAMAEGSALPDSDAVLMSQVDSEVSESVPDALAPLTDLVAWDSSEVSTEKAATAETHPTHKKSAAAPGAKALVQAAN